MSDGGLLWRLLKGAVGVLNDAPRQVQAGARGSVRGPNRIVMVVAVRIFNRGARWNTGRPVNKRG